MPLPYSNATAGQAALNDIQKILRAFGCSKFATGTDWDSGEVFIQFEHQGRLINLRASAKGYAAAWLRENPWNTRRKGNLEQHQSRALEIGSVAVYSILRDWVKGQVTAIDTGVMTFEAAFLSHIMLPSGRSVIEEVQQRKMLPGPSENGDAE